MQKIVLDYVVSAPAGALGHTACQAVSLLRRGDREQARRLYREVVAGAPGEATTWSTLAVFALLERDIPSADAHVRRALERSPDCVDALVNLSLVLLAQGKSQAIFPVLKRAVALAPDHSKALANYGTMLHAARDHAAADEYLRRAAEASPASWRIALERASVSRTRGDFEQMRERLLSALALVPAALPDRLVALPRKAPHQASDLEQVLCEAGDLLREAGQPFHLMAGTLLALVRDGALLGHDKDIDLALPWDSDRDRVAEMFGRHPGFAAPPHPSSDGRLWAFSVIHKASRVGIDLFFLKPEADGVLAGCGKPPQMLFSRVRPFELGELRWRDRTWAIPSPPEQYLEDIYGPAWRTPDPYFDTMLSNPSRTADSVRVAVSIGLVRLGDALQAQDWLKAHALCRQLLAREAIAEVVAVEAALRQRCPQVPA